MRAGLLVTTFMGVIIWGAGAVISNTLLAETKNIPTVETIQLVEYDTTEYWELSDAKDYPEDTLSLDMEYETDLECFAKNIYFEAGNQELAGKYAVGHVVLNRVESERYPDTICEVIQQGPVRESWKTANDPSLDVSERVYYPRRNMCQFSWYCDGLSDDPFEGENWAKSLEIAEEMLSMWYASEYRVDITDGAMYYHATYVSPYWAKTMKVVAHIGDHIFYR